MRKKRKYTYICLSLQNKTQEDKSEDNSVGYLQGVEGNKRKWYFSEHTFLYIFDFWKHGSIPHIQSKIKATRIERRCKLKLKANRNSETNHISYKYHNHTEQKEKELIQCNLTQYWLYTLGWGRRCGGEGEELQTIVLVVLLFVVVWAKHSEMILDVTNYFKCNTGLSKCVDTARSPDSHWGRRDLKIWNGEGKK